MSLVMTQDPIETDRFHSRWEIAAPAEAAEAEEVEEEEAVTSAEEGPPPVGGNFFYK